MADTFFIGDTHFSHKNIIKFDTIKPYRQFDTIQEHDIELVKRWNSVVRPKDVVWHLGDFCFGRSALAIADQLNGDKRLILGNHDTYPAAEYLKYFTKVCGAREFHGMIMTHIPVHPSQLEYRFTHNIHGHLHTNNIESDPHYINVSAEQVNLTPISFDEIKDKFL